MQNKQGKQDYLRLKMFESVAKLTKMKLSHLDESERSDAQILLMLVGLKHYSLLFGKTQVTIPVLQQLCEKYAADLDCKTKQKKQSFSKIKYSHIRKSRSDAMAHFPFADDTGTVTDILKSCVEVSGDETSGPETNSGCKLMQMGKPGRKRFIAKVFHEMRLNQVGIRLCDFPETLNRLGLKISTELKLLLEETRSNYLLDGSMRNYDEECRVFTKETFISLSQLHEIVTKFMHKQRDLSTRSGDEGYTQSLNHKSSLAVEELQFIQSVLTKRVASSDNRQYPKEERNEGSSNRSDVEGSDDDDDRDSLNGEEQQEQEVNSLSECDQPERPYRHHNNTRHQQHRQQHHHDSAEVNYHSDHNSHHHNNQQSAHKPNNFTQPGKHTKTGPAFGPKYMHHIKKVPSKIASMVRHDRNSFLHAKHQTEKSALASLARRRVDILTSMTHGIPYRGNVPSGEAHVYGTERSQRHTTDRQQALRQQKQFRKKVTNLNSGTAVNEIADSFLHSQVAKELLLAPPDRAYQGQPPLKSHEVYANSYDNTYNRNHNEFILESRRREKYGDDKETITNRQAIQLLNTVPVTGSYSGYSGSGSGRVEFGGDASRASRDRGQQQGRQRADSGDHVYLRGDKMRVSHDGKVDVRPAAEQKGNGDDEDDESLGYDHHTVRSKEKQRHVDREAKKLYSSAPGWKESKSGGGWVADFGPSHTHANYTGAIPFDPHPVADNYDYKPWLKQHGSEVGGVDGKNKASGYASIVTGFNSSVAKSALHEPADWESEERDNQDFGMNDSLLLAMSRDIDAMRSEKRTALEGDKALYNIKDNFSSDGDDVQDLDMSTANIAQYTKQHSKTSSGTKIPDHISAGGSKSNNFNTNDIALTAQSYLSGSHYSNNSSSGKSAAKTSYSASQVNYGLNGLDEEDAAVVGAGISGDDNDFVKTSRYSGNHKKSSDNYFNDSDDSSENKKFEQVWTESSVNKSTNKKEAGTPRSNNLLKVMQNTASLHEVR